MKITSKVVLAGLLLSLSLTSCNNLSKNKNNEEDASKKTEVTESADSKEKEGTAEKDADSKEDAKEDKKEGTTEKDSKDKKDSKEDADKENSEEKEDADSNEEGGKSREELIAKLEQAVFDSKVTVRALEILQTEAPDSIEGREAEVQEMIDRANEVLENATAVLDKAQGNN